MSNPAEIKKLIEEAVQGSQVVVIPNGSPCGQESLLLDNSHALEIARFLRDDPRLRFDYASNVTGIDWPETRSREVVKSKEIIDGQERLIERTTETVRPGFLEAVYHLYSMERREGPLIIRLRTGDRLELAIVPSLTPVWRGAEFQEREVYDLFGVRFEGHPDLRRILMWDGFQDFPMRRDYISPDDYEYEPTPHDEVLERASARDQGEESQRLK